VRTRTHRRPLSIWIIAAIWSLGALVPTVRWAMSSPFGASGAVWAVLIMTAVFIGYQAVALIRLSRWPVLMTIASLAWTLIDRRQAHFDWRGHYPMLGVFVFLVPCAVYLACTLPHWRKMNWGPFGRPYRPPEDQVEVFA
jgi:membrane associated rhomboid family serine protease